MREILRGPLKAALAAGLTVGLLLILLNPPSLSGAAGLAVWAGAGLVFALGTAWVFVAMSGKESMGDAEFERLVVRSEQLALDPELAAAATDPASGTDFFELLVAEAIEELPPEFQELLKATPVVVSQLGNENRAYGHYFGDTVARDDYHDRIIIYQDTLVRDFGWDRDLLRSQVVRTLRHEVAHHLGWGERGVAELGL
ncbi:MAG TPA: metallopeptidase family protein [Thermoleophilaceae bacterium]